MKDNELIEKIKSTRGKEMFYIHTIEYAIKTFLDEGLNYHSDKELTLLKRKISRNGVKLLNDIEIYEKRVNNFYKEAIEIIGGDK